MRRFRFLLVIESLALCAVLVLAVWQVRRKAGLLQERAATDAELRAAADFSKKLTLLEKQIEEMKGRETGLLRQVPTDERYPFALIKALTAEAERGGFFSIAFTLKSAPEVDTAPAGAQEPQQPEMPLPGDPGATPAPKTGLGALLPIAMASKQDSGAGTLPVKNIYLQMECTGDFGALLKLLEKIQSMERIVKVDGVKIGRKKEVMPNQEFTLDLVAYTF